MFTDKNGKNKKICLWVQNIVQEQSLDLLSSENPDKIVTVHLKQRLEKFLLLFVGMRGKFLILSMPFLLQNPSTRVVEELVYTVSQVQVPVACSRLQTHSQLLGQIFSGRSRVELPIRIVLEKRI